MLSSVNDAILPQRNSPQRVQSEITNRGTTKDSNQDRQESFVEQEEVDQDIFSQDKALDEQAEHEVWVEVDPRCRSHDRPPPCRSSKR